jgi:hypothetical protein
MESLRRTNRNMMRQQRWFLPVYGLVLSLCGDARVQAQNNSWVWIEGGNTSAANITGRVLVGLATSGKTAMPGVLAPTRAQTSQTAATNNTKVANRARLFPRAGFAARLAGGKIQGSNENATSGFADLATIPKKVADSKWIDISFPNKIAYRYLRFFAPQESWANIAELEFYNGKNKIAGTPYGTFGSRDNNGNTFERAFDSDIKTFFDAPAPNSQYLGIEIATASNATVSSAMMPVTADGKARRHYHIGNSLTDTIGEYMRATAKSAGYADDFFDRQTIPGSPLHFNWKATGGFGTPYREAFVKHAPLTDLVMQVFIDNGDSQTPEYSIQFYDLAKQSSPQVKPWIYGQWPVTGGGVVDGKVQGSPSWEERTLAYMRTYVTHKLNFLNERPASDVQVVPGGLALINLKHAVEAGKVPGMTDFFAANFDDDIHLSGAGRYFIGLVHFATLYRQNPVGLPLVGLNDKLPNLTPEQTRAYQQVAWDTAAQFAQNGGRSIGVAIPAHIDARARVGSTPPFGDPYVRYINEKSNFEYLLNAPAAGKYELRVALATEQPDRKLDVLLNYAAAGSVTAPTTKQGFADSEPLVLNLKAGLNLLRLHVPTNRPYNIDSLKITPVGGAPLKNTLPQTTFNGFQRDIELGGFYTEMFNASDAETPVAQLKVTAHSDNPTLLPEGSVKVEAGEFKNQWDQVFTHRLTVTPAAGQTSGRVRVVVTIEDSGNPQDKTVAPMRRVVALGITVKPKEETK